MNNCPNLETDSEFILCVFFILSHLLTKTTTTTTAKKQANKSIAQMTMNVKVEIYLLSHQIRNYIIYIIYILLKSIISFFLYFQCIRTVFSWTCILKHNLLLFPLTVLFDPDCHS